MAEILTVPNPMVGYRKDYYGAGELTIPEVTQVRFAPGELKGAEIAHARGLMRESGYSMALLIRIAMRMIEKDLSYREAYLEVREEE